MYYPLPAGLVLTIILALSLPKDGSYPVWSLVLTVLGVIGGLCWSYLLIELLIDILDSLGIILNLEEAFLGLTILAIGNALPDAFTTVALAKQG